MWRLMLISASVLLGCGDVLRVPLKNTAFRSLKSVSAAATSASMNACTGVGDMGHTLLNGLGPDGDIRVPGAVATLRSAEYSQ